MTGSWGGCRHSSMKMAAAIRNDPISTPTPTMDTAFLTGGRRSASPPFTRNPASGRATVSQTSEVIASTRSENPASASQQVDVSEIDRLLVPEDADDDRQPHRSFCGRHRHHEEHYDIAAGPV